MSCFQPSCPHMLSGSCSVIHGQAGNASISGGHGLQGSERSRPKPRSAGIGWVTQEGHLISLSLLSPHDHRKDLFGWALEKQMDGGAAHK